MTAFRPVFSLLGFFALAACETPIAQQTYAPTSAALMPESQARAECEFAVQAATEPMAHRPVAKGTSFDEQMGEAIADGIALEEEEATLFVSCMRSKGFVRT